MQRFVYVCLGSAAGGGLRYLVGVWTERRFGSGFPLGTLIVNVAGCFLMALVMHLAAHVAGFPANLRFALTTGLLGGLTTYSAFNYETARLLKDGAPGLALANAGLTLAGCFVAGFAGLVLARWFVGGV